MNVHDMFYMMSSSDADGDDHDGNAEYSTRHRCQSPKQAQALGLNQWARELVLPCKFMSYFGHPEYA